jgi:pSer/pThr/pTyr-binding forkhead associated (FHA) protein
MDVVLKVLEGAKSGAKVTIKKAEFVIGRSPDCHLCAGSSAVSRRHCAILRSDNRVAVKDLGSRNGTLVNGEKITGEVELASGDEITVGPLKFLITLTAGMNNVKRPEVKSVAEAVARTAESAPAPKGDNDVSQWLIYADTSALNETQTIRMDDTNAVQMKLQQALAEEALAKAAMADTADEPPKEEAESEADEKSAAKKGPGKLPKVPQKPSSKDSREAAAEALRAWSRRR